MALEEEINEARKEIISDGYDMSVGELINLYKDSEIFINPVFQRLFRWDNTRKTRFIESLLLGIPIPPIFVYQNADGIWELIDGLQRLSTILEFVGVLKLEDNQVATSLILEGTNILPSLSNIVWHPEAEAPLISLPISAQLRIKRARLRVEILKQESDPNAKYELFQRLNTGGVGLSEQEVRNCVAVMVDPTFHEWIVNLSEDENFLSTIAQTDYALEKQVAVELCLRHLAFCHVPYVNGLDVHEYLDDALLKLIEDDNFNRTETAQVFKRTFQYLNDALGANAFKRYNGENFQGKFLMSVFEVLSVAVSRNIEELDGMQPNERNTYLTQKAQDLWGNPVFIANSGAGVRGTTRLVGLLPLAQNYFVFE